MLSIKLYNLQELSLHTFFRKLNSIFQQNLICGALALFTIRQPDFLPTGYDLQEGMVTPSDWVFLFYGNSSGNLVIAQLPIGEITINEPGEMIESVPVGPVTVGQKNTVGVRMLTDKEVETLLVNNQLSKKQSEGSPYR